jgi:GGDEF domain-containing protein
VIDDDAGIRRLVRTGLELEGFTVIEAATLSQARSVGAERVDGVVLDRQLPDGDGLLAYEEFRDRYVDAIVVMHSSSFVPNGYPSVSKGDIDGMVELFGLVLTPTPRLDRAPEVARAVADAIVEEWIELCRWDPELPADNRPPIPASVVTAVASALERPQPLGWGLDPALEPVAQAYVLNHEHLDVAVAQLVCLREAYERQVVDKLPATEQLEAARRLTMIVQRLMTVVVRAGVADLQEQAFTDPITGLSNVRAYELDLRREQARAVRHHRPLTVARVGVAPDASGETFRAVGQAMRAVTGDEVHAYRVGFGEFALLLPNMVPVDAEFVLGPLGAARVDDVTIGLATYPADPLDELDELAGRRRAPVRVPSSQRVGHQDRPDL